jgi:hypothetical protein
VKKNNKNFDKINMNSTRMRMRMKKKGLRGFSKLPICQLKKKFFEKRKNLIYL